MFPITWTDAGAAPHHNRIGIDPELIAPESGDYRPAPGSPAIAYGCRVFASPLQTPDRKEGASAANQNSDRKGGAIAADPAPSRHRGERAPCEVAPRRSVIDAGGSISADAVWNADLVRVWDHVTIENGVTLTILPGTRVEFQDYYRLNVQGALVAVGTSAARIAFTTDEPAAFAPDASHEGAWNGIRFVETSALNPPSRLAYCDLEYSKALAADHTPYAWGGGALSVIGFAKLAVEHCDFRRNVADHGGAICLYRGADILLANSLIHDNDALGNAGAVYCAYSHPRLINNTIVQNRVQNADEPFIDTCGVLSFISKPRIANCIIRDTLPDVVYLHSEVWNAKPFHLRCNNIPGYAGAGGNISANPRFLDPGEWDFRLASTSPCVDAGDLAASGGYAVDAAGVRRVSRGAIDIGAHETLFGDLDCSGRVDFFDIDPFVLALTDPDGYAAAYPLCDVLLADTSADGAVDFFDIDPFVDALMRAGGAATCRP